MERVVVVGAGLAGVRACEGLRQRGFGGEVVLVGEESRDPYDRPPLSKQFLAGTLERDKVALRRPEQLEALGLTRRHERATGLDVGVREVTLGSGERLAYDGLVVATGARARRLPGLSDLPGVHHLRTVEDSESLRAALRPGARLLVVGGGFIGMEAAATARGLGVEVTVVEPLAEPLGRVLGDVAGEACRRLHLERGVTVVTGQSVTALSSGERGTFVAQLSGGGLIEADAVLVGVGAVLNLEWLEGSGLTVTPAGVVCDETLRAGPFVVAAGDLCCWPHRGGQPIHLEHWTNAAEQGDHAAGTLLGGDEPFRTVPYVWSDQYDVKIQLLGVPAPGDAFAVVDGDLDSGRFCAAYGRDGVLTAVVGFAKPRSVMRLRALVEAAAPFEEAAAALG